MAVKYDMRKLDQPVTLNGNPFIGEQGARLPLNAVSGYAATVSQAIVSAASGPGGQTRTDNTAANEAQVKAFEKIGGDPSLTINRVVLKTDSMGINMLLAMGSSVRIVATGTVQRIQTPAAKRKEPAQ
jgi:hypothetical protein